MEGRTNALLDLPWFQSKPCEDLTQLTCRWNGSCQIRSQKIHGLPLHLRQIVCHENSRVGFKSDGIRDSSDRKPIEEIRLTSLGAPPCPRSITVCSDLLSELPTIHKDRTLAPLCLGILGKKQRKKASQQFPTDSPKHLLPKTTPDHIRKETMEYHIPNKLALLGCALTTSTSTSLSFPFPFPLLLVPPTKDEGE